MKTGTKSVLFGAHCFLLHPFFVWKAWLILYGKPNFQTIVSFFVHDIGYIGCENMDDEKGEQHPYLGAKIMHKLFDPVFIKTDIAHGVNPTYWYEFTLYHSRFLAKKNNAQYSKLCVADKLAIVVTPSWLYVPMVTLTGEIKEYMKDFEKSNYSDNGTGVIKERSFGKDRYKWHKAVKDYVQSWVDEHKDMKEDKWTSVNRNVVDKNGAWK